MAHSLSAKKRIRQNLKSRARNRWRKAGVRSEIRAYRESILHGTVEEAEAQLRKIFSLLDKIAAKGTLHRNTAARYKSRLSARLNTKKAAA